MDTLVDGYNADNAPPPLSYDEAIPYEEQIQGLNPETPAGLAGRIGSSRVYLLSESSTTRVGKRKHDEDDPDATTEDIDMDEEGLTHRGNAILLRGTPISYLPTARLFAYATHFDAHPLGLEWVDDNTCIFVFNSRHAARTGFKCLQKSAAEEPDAEDCVTGKPIPVDFWPPEERINRSLGKGEGIKGIIRMRWARAEDVKKKDARRQSEFYRKYGTRAGKELFNGREGPGAARNRKRQSPEPDLAARLDQDLDNFLKEDDSAPDADNPPSPPSKMRSDYIAADGRTLLERTLDVVAESNSLASRITAPLPRRARDKPALVDRLVDEPRRRHRGRRGQKVSDDEGPIRPTKRPRKTQQELDDELDAFLNEGTVI